jgi:hypothetical protein
MAYTKVPTKVKIKGAASPSRRTADNSPALAKSQMIGVKVIQKQIDLYNECDIYKINSFFKDYNLTNDFIVVRMFHENLIKFIDESSPEDIQLDAWFRQIDARERVTDVSKWVSTPFPYLEKGVIVAISPEVQMKYAKLKKELNDLGLTREASKVIIPKQGDVIEVRSYYNSTWYKENRFYLDKQEQCEDFVRNQTELRLSNFDHYFRMESYDLAGIYKQEEYVDKVFFSDEEEPLWYMKAKTELDYQISELKKEQEDALNKSITTPEE